MKLGEGTIAALLVTAVLVGVGAGLAASPASAAVALPNACKLLPSEEVVTATGYTPATLGPRETSSRVDGGPSHSCTYKRGKLKLTVSVEPGSQATGGGYGGLPGLEVVKKPSFGPKGLFVYDNRAKYQFATISFVSGTYYWIIYSQGVRNAKILAVGRYVYLHP